MMPADDFTLSTIKIEGRELTFLPALIDPHVHFRVPGGEEKEDWRSASLAAVKAGITCVCDMPNNSPPCTTARRLQEKQAEIDRQLSEVQVPIRYGLYFGADKDHLDEIERVKNRVVGVKIFMGCSTGGLVIDTDSALDEAFKRAAEAKLLVAVHAEDEAILAKKRTEFKDSKNPADHSRMRPKEAAIRATAKAIELCAKYQSPLYILHMSTREELDLVRQAKKEGLPVYAEATTHHLFFTESAYASFGTLVQMNPPLRQLEDQEALWDAVRDGTIDIIGTDHAPHTLAEKQLPFGKSPSGIPGIDTLLPLLLDAVNQNRLSLKRMIELTRINCEALFGFSPNHDLVLVDLNLEKEIQEQDIGSKCSWSPYCGRILKGWPVYTLLRGKVYMSNQGTSGGKRELEEYLLSNQGGVFATP